MSTTQVDKKKIWDSFLERWPIEKLEKMSLEEYTQASSTDTFTYWIESKTEILGSIWGGSAFKFGIFSRQNQQEKETDKRVSYDSHYGWYTKYGASLKEAYDNVLHIIIDIAKAAAIGNTQKIDEIDLGISTKWKIAFLYQNQDKPIALPIYKIDNLRIALGKADKRIPCSQLHARLLDERHEIDLLEYAEMLWQNIQEKKSKVTKIDNDNQAKEASDNTNLEKLKLVNGREPVNIILYGPPGTGKTYASIEEALRLIDPDFCNAAPKPARKEIKDRFDQYVASGDIRFVTFHQSFSYEDFVEGLRPEVGDDGQIRYDVVNGVFKTLCETAVAKVIKQTDSFVDLKRRAIWKMSLGNSTGIDAYIYNECIENEYVLLGYGSMVDFSGCQNRDEIIKKYEAKDKKGSESSYAVSAMCTFVLKMKIGDIVVVTEGNQKFRAIGVITGNYCVIDRKDDTYGQCRKVKWLRVYSPSLPSGQLMHGQFSQMTLYELRDGSINLNSLQELLREKTPTKPVPTEKVLIIDEINRGNVSRIFGELITLIEPTKRAGKQEVLEVILPYSKKRFSIPSNVHLIGTMNTADRSLTSVDIALRRRFTFKEMRPEPELLDTVVIEGLNIGHLLRKMNERIEVLFGREHCIGHAYFVRLKDVPEYSRLKELARIFRQQIFPLLQEYSFADWDRIAMVLNNHNKPKELAFISKSGKCLADIFKSDIPGHLNQEDRGWVVNDDAFEDINSYLQIIEDQP